MPIPPGLPGRSGDRGEPRVSERCWLAAFAAPERRECEGRMDRAHLVKQQRLVKEGHAELCEDPRTWKLACRRHHTMWDNYRGLVVPRSAVPAELETLLDGVGLAWLLDRRFGAA